MQVRMVKTDVTEYCNNIPKGCKVIEKSLMIAYEKTYCCSLTPSAYIVPLRYDIDTEEFTDEVQKYYDDLNSEGLDPYYRSYHEAVKNSELDEEEYEDLCEAVEIHQANHVF